MVSLLITPEYVGSRISDPDFLDKNGNLIAGSKERRLKDSAVFYSGNCNTTGEVYYNITIVFIKDGASAGIVSFLRYKDEAVFNYQRYYFVNFHSKIEKRELLTREEFIDRLLNEYPTLGEWALWNL